MVIGVLDGVHVGHQALLPRAQDGYRVLAAAFHPHPKTVLGHTTPLPLTTWRTRSRELEAGVAGDPFGPSFRLLETPAFEFIRDLHARHRFSRWWWGRISDLEGRRFGDAVAGSGTSTGL